MSAERTPPSEMPDFWIGSTEWGRWWDAEPANVVTRVHSDGPRELRLVELERTGERFLVGTPIDVPVQPGRAVGVTVFRPPHGWDIGAHIDQDDLEFHSQPELYGRLSDAPVTSQQRRERTRRGHDFA